MTEDELISEIAHRMTAAVYGKCCVITGGRAKVTVEHAGRLYGGDKCECREVAAEILGLVKGEAASLTREIVGEAVERLRSADHPPPSTEFYEGYYGGISDACNMIEKLVAADSRAGVYKMPRPSNNAG